MLMSHVYVLFSDWFRCDGIRVAFEVDRRRRVQRRHHDSHYCHVRR